MKIFNPVASSYCMLTHSVINCKFKRIKDAEILEETCVTLEGIISPIFILKIEISVRNFIIRVRSGNLGRRNKSSRNGCETVSSREYNS